MEVLNVAADGYTLYSLCWYFCIYSVLGWCMEVCFDTVRTGKFVNRGFLNGPVCPIYGFGMVIVILALTPFKENIFLLYIGTVILASSLELVTGYVLKKIFHTSWWDYSKDPFNLGGYICLKFSLLWGVGGVFVMDIIQPMIEGLVDSIPHFAGSIAVIVMLCLFVADAIVTIVAMAKLNTELGVLTSLGEGLRKGSNALAKGLGDTALNMDSRFDAAKDKLGDMKTVAADKLDAAKDKLIDMKDAASDKFDAAREENAKKLDAMRAEWSKGSHLVRRRLLKAFPNAKHTEYNDALTKLKESILNLHNKTDKKDDNK